jgi:phosphoribosylamine-glycine ligase
VILPLLQSDLYEVMMKCATQQLRGTDVHFDSERRVVGVVTAISGYPLAYKKGVEIFGE